MPFRKSAPQGHGCNVTPSGRFVFALPHAPSKFFARAKSAPDDERREREEDCPAPAADRDWMTLVCARVAVLDEHAQFVRRRGASLRGRSRVQQRRDEAITHCKRDPYHRTVLDGLIHRSRGRIVFFAVRLPISFAKKTSGLWLRKKPECICVTGLA